ncbi:MAG: hypothetical protein WB771_14725 [Solirubrobacterales bacterium]
MYARVVRFTGVSAEHVDEVVKQIEESGGPPPDVPAKGIRMMFDESQGTSVVVVFFETEEDMKKGNEALNAMDASDTPGTRASVDICEVKASMDA